MSREENLRYLSMQEQKHYGTLNMLVRDTTSSRDITFRYLVPPKYVDAFESASKERSLPQRSLLQRIIPQRVSLYQAITTVKMNGKWYERVRKVSDDLVEKVLSNPNTTFVRPIAAKNKLTLVA